MFKKECCKKCWNSTDFAWTESDEKYWKEGYIYCPPKYREKEEKWIRSITDQPPSKCPYYLENIL